MIRLQDIQVTFNPGDDSGKSRITRRIARGSGTPIFNRDWL